MALPACERCGRTDPRSMIGLMTLWFGPLVEMEPDYGYFYLCTLCYRQKVQPRFEEVHGRLAELHPDPHIAPRPAPQASTRAARASRTETQHA